MARQSGETRSSPAFDADPAKYDTSANGDHFCQNPMSSGDTLVDRDGDAIMNNESHDLNTSEQFSGVKDDSQLHVNGNRSSHISSASSDTVSASSKQALDILGQGMKEMVQTVQKLRHLGVEDLVLPLPKIVVVGDQSTGKSSLIEGMSGIKVPRKAGTCTRCPLEIELSDKSDSQWSCNISLYYKFAYDTHGLRSGRASGATRQRPLGPWIAQDPETYPFYETTTKADVPGIIERAQLAVLNPRIPYEDFLPDSLAEPPTDHQVSFSPNVIRLKISGPGLPNLAFHDLPGVINVSDDTKEDYLVKLVKNLVTMYVKEDKCINLLAIPMSDDPANSSALQLIGDAKAIPRTVGVLTKPDRIQQCEDMDQWIQILRGKKFGLGHGYFVVKNNADVNVDHETARTEERKFFDTEDLWATDFREHSDRFGTFHLQNALSEILTLNIRESLPSIIDRIQSKAEQIEGRLSELPEPPQGNLPMQILEQILRFGHALQLSIDGDSEMYLFQRDWNLLTKQFCKTMSESRPILRRPSFNIVNRSAEDQGQPSTPTPNRRPTAPIMVDSDDEKAGPSSSSKTANKRGHPGVGEKSPAKRTRLHEIPLHSAGEKSSPGNFRAFNRYFTFAEIRQYLQNVQTIGLPGQNPKAIERMAKECCQLWDRPLGLLLDSTAQLCRHTILTQVAAAFAQWRQTPLYLMVQSTCENFLSDIMGRQRDLTALILRREQLKPTASNEDLLNATNEKMRDVLLTWRRGHRVQEKQIEQAADSETPLREGRPPGRFTDEQLGPDPYIQEIDAMARLKAWYEVSSARFADNICQVIYCELLLECRQGLELALREAIGLDKVDATARCATLLTVNPDDEQERVQLQKEKETLTKAQLYLQRFSHRVEDE